MTPAPAVQTPTLAALIVAHNEEERLPACLAAVAFCDEIVVVLDRCTDRSKEIALAAGARIVEGAWPLEGPRRRAGAQAVQSDWILIVDADETISPELAAEIRQVVATSDADAHAIPFDNYIGKRLVRHGWGASFGVGSRRSLFRRGVVDWGDERVHPSLIWKENLKVGHRLVNRTKHFVDEDISDLLRRLDRYTTLRAQDLRASGDIGSSFHAYRRIFSRFWKCYVRRKGYREGGLGFLIALCAALYPLLSYLKARYDFGDSA